MRKMDGDKLKGEVVVIDKKESGDGRTRSCTEESLSLSVFTCTNRVKIWGCLECIEGNTECIEDDYREQSNWMFEEQWDLRKCDPINAGNYSTDTQRDRGRKELEASCDTFHVAVHRWESWILVDEVRSRSRREDGVRSTERKISKSRL